MGKVELGLGDFRLEEGRWEVIAESGSFESGYFFLLLYMV